MYHSRDPTTAAAGYNPLVQKPTTLRSVGRGSIYQYFGPPPDAGYSYGAWGDDEQTFVSVFEEDIPSERFHPIDGSPLPYLGSVLYKDVKDQINEVHSDDTDNFCCGKPINSNFCFYCGRNQMKRQALASVFRTVKKMRSTIKAENEGQDVTEEEKEILEEIESMDEEQIQTLKEEVAADPELSEWMEEDDETVEGEEDEDSEEEIQDIDVTAAVKRIRRLAASYSTDKEIEVAASLMKLNPKQLKAVRAAVEEDSDLAEQVFEDSNLAEGEEDEDFDGEEDLDLEDTVESEDEDCEDCDEDFEEEVTAAAKKKKAKKKKAKRKVKAEAEDFEDSEEDDIDLDEDMDLVESEDEDLEDSEEDLEDEDFEEEVTAAAKKKKAKKKKAKRKVKAEAEDCEDCDEELVTSEEDLEDSEEDLEDEDFEEEVTAAAKKKKAKKKKAKRKVKAEAEDCEEDMDLAEGEDEESDEFGEDLEEALDEETSEACAYEPIASIQTLGSIIVTSDVKLDRWNSNGEDPFYMLSVKGSPVAQIYLRDQANPSAVKATFLTDSYSSALVAAICNPSIGLNKTLESVKARRFAMKINKNRLATAAVKTAEKRLKAGYGNKLAALQDDFLHCANIAIAGFSKNVYRDVSDDLRAALYRNMVRAGVHAPETIIEESFKEGGIPFLKSVLVKAQEYMAMSDEALKEVSKFIQDVPHTTPAGEETFVEASYGQKLAAGNFPVQASTIPGIPTGPLKYDKHALKQTINLKQP